MTVVMRNALRIKYSKIGLIQYLFLYMMYISANSVFFHYNRTTLQYIFIAFSIIVLIRYKGRSLTIEYFIGTGITLLGMCLSRVINNGGYGIEVFINILSISLLVYSCYYIDKENALPRFLRLVYVLSIFSLIFWLISFLSPELVKAVLVGDTNMFRGTKGSFIYSFRYASWAAGDCRNNGVFSEPGRYQCVLNTAIFFLIFCGEHLKMQSKDRFKYLVVCILTLASTQSTTGYMGLAGMLVAYLFLHKDAMKTRIFKICMFVGSIVGLDFAIRGTDSLLYQAVLIKIFTNTGTFDINASTGIYRMNGITACWHILKNNFFGCGDRYADLYTAVSGGVESAGAGLFVFAAVTGAISIIGIFLIYLLPAFKCRFSLIKMICYIFLIINTASAQSDIMYGCILCIPVFCMIQHDFGGGEEINESWHSNISQSR